MPKIEFYLYLNILPKKLNNFFSDKHYPRKYFTTYFKQRECSQGSKIKGIKIKQKGKYMNEH